MSTNINSSNSPYTNTIPASDCQNGSPISKYAGYGVNAWEVLYSIWVANQSTIGAQFTRNQAIAEAPTQPPPTQGPANIFIIRHGEKSPSGAPLDYCLDNNGIYRACKLIEFVNQLAVQGTPISYLVTCNPCHYNTQDPSMRPEQTISMVSFMLNIPIYIFGSSQDFSDFIAGVFGNGRFDGLNILVCWEHSAIQGLCLNILNAAGVSGRLDVSHPGDVLMYGNNFFKAIGINGNPLCPNGNYLAPNSSSSGDYYLDPTYLPPNLPTYPYPYPFYIGPDSKYYPYWNTDNFQSVYWFRSNSETNYIFEIGLADDGTAKGFKIFDEPIETCSASCDLHIGLYQPLKTLCESSPKYTNEGNCVVPPESWFHP